MSKKPPTPPVAEPTELEIEAKDLELTSQSLELEAKEKLKPDMVRILKKIAYFTAKVGLPLEEACLLVNYPFERFQDDMKLEPLIGKIIRVKELEFKKDMLHTLTAKARSGDDKLAQWLLEKKFPDQYGDKKKAQGGDDPDIIFEAIQFIRRNGDNSSMVSETAGRAMVIRKNSDGSVGPSLPVRIDQILGSSEPKKTP